jgi:DNA repair photolyase
VSGASVRGRGAAANPKNRFEPLEVVGDPAARDPDDPGPRTRFYRDATRTIIAHNDSPDIGFDSSVNPYRGCEHGCIYCYARPYHEYLGLSAGLDFETKILVKADAPALLRKALMARSWKPDVIALSGVTDPYQPAERRLRLTRRCLEVLAEFRNPATVVTKNHLVTRDADVLGELASCQAARVNVSITTLDPKLQRIMEPRTSAPVRRLAAVEALARAGIPVHVLVAPVIPALNDEEIPAILAAAGAAGAGSASHAPVRLPHGVKDLFADWLGRHFPDRKAKVLNRIRAMRGGRLNEPGFGARMRAQGEMAAQVRALFDAGLRKAGLAPQPPALSVASFRRPSASRDQLALL